MLRGLQNPALRRCILSNGRFEMILARCLHKLPEHVKLETSPKKAFITIDCPKMLRSPNADTIKTIYEHLRRFQARKQIVVVNAVCDKGFEVCGYIKGLKGFELRKARNCFKQMYALNYLIKNYKIPFIAIADGAIMGSGSGMFLQARYRVVTERTPLSMPETAFGLFPHVGNSYFLSRLKFRLGMFLALTGHELVGPELVAAGIATHFCRCENLPELKSKLVKCDDPEMIPEILARCAEPPLKRYSLSSHLHRINRCFNERSVEDIFRNLEEDGSLWAFANLQKLKTMSPMSLMLAHRQIDEASYLSLAESLKMEYRMVSRLRNSDFREGFQSLIFEKRKPIWNAADLSSVKYHRVAGFFAKLPEADELRL